MAFSQKIALITLGAMNLGQFLYIVFCCGATGRPAGTLTNDDFVRNTSPSLRRGFPSDDQLYIRQKNEFVNALGYFTDGAYGGESVAVNKRTYNKKTRKRRFVETDDVSDRNLPVSIIPLLDNPVTIFRVEETIDGIKSLRFPIDVTVTSLQVDVTTTRNLPNAFVITPPGNAPNVTARPISDNQYTVRVDKPLTGNWTILIGTSSQRCTISATASSLTDFEAAFTDNHGVEMSGQPIAGSNSTFLKVTPIGEPSNNWTTLLARSPNGTTLLTLALGELMGRAEPVFLVQVHWPSQDVYVSLAGVDSQGNAMLRQQDTIVQPLGLRLKLLHLGVDEITDCRPFQIPVSIINTGPATDVTLDIQHDNQHFAASLSSRYVEIGPLSSVNVTATLTALFPPKPGDTVYISISASEPDGRTQYLQQNLFVGTDLKCKPSDVSSKGRRVVVAFILMMLIPLVHVT